MRIPLHSTIPICLLTVLLMGWIGTRRIDFLTPPSETRLSKIRAEALASLPVPRIEADAISVKVAPLNFNPTIPDTTLDTTPLIDPADLSDITTPPALDTYSDHAPDGAPKLLALAAALEQAGAFQRSLLAYERILDLSQSDPEPIQSAISAIRRLKPSLPSWNIDPETAAPVVIHIGTGEKFAEILPNIFMQITRELDNASSGIVKFSHNLHIGRTIQSNNGPTPVALWITGSGATESSTDVLSFATDDPENLHKDLLKTTFNIIRSHLSKTASHNPAPEALDEPLEALESHITRLLWNEFGKSLNPEP